MKAKTYRVDATLAQAAYEKMIDYIADNRKGVTEAQIINASIEKGIKDLTDEEITKFMEGKN